MRSTCHWPEFHAIEGLLEGLQPWAVLELPADPNYYYAAAGCVQRVDLANGDVLAPIHFKPKGGAPPYTTTVLNCSIAGRTLTYRYRGEDVKRPFEADRDKPPAEGANKGGPSSNRQSGLFEPSLTYHRGRFYLTMRNDRAGYAATSADGMRFDEPRRWRFDDGAELGNHNTQQHWATHSDGQFLVYTRKGANNDHVPRHRAPLFIAQVDTDRMCIVRSTERTSYRSAVLRWEILA